MAEKNTSTLLILTSYRCSGRMAQLSEGALVRWRKLGCNWVPTPACLLPFFFSFIVFLPFGFLLFILTADLVSFARFLRKRISSLHIFITLSPSFHGFITNQFNDLLPVGFLAQIDGFHSDVTNLHSQKSEVLGISNGHIGGPKLSANMASPYKALQRSMKCFGK